MTNLTLPGMFMPGIFELLILAVVVGVPILIAILVIIVATNRKHPTISGNLTPCPDCNGPVSVRAHTCPHCGAPLKPMA